MGLSPAQRVPLLMEGPHASQMLQDASALQALARLEAVQLVEQLPTDRLAPTKWIDGIGLMLDLEIDAKAERLRLSKEIERIDQELSKCKAKLANPAFSERAPKAVVDQERDRLIKFEQSRLALAAQLDRVKGRNDPLEACVS